MLTEHGVPVIVAARAARATIFDLDDGARCSCCQPGMRPHRIRTGGSVVLTFADARRGPPSDRVTLLRSRDVTRIGMQDELSDDVREFCRRRGIRFRPFAWRYGVGHFEGDRFVRRG